MKTDNNKLSAFLLFLSIGLMMIPIAQKNLDLVKETQLYGVLPSKDTTISFNNFSWFKGIYSKEKEAYLNDNFGFRNWLVRLRNQVNYSLFDRLADAGTVMGKSGYIFSGDYIRAYCGMDYTGDSLIASRLKKIKAIQDTLSKKGVLFLLVFAPGQASYNSEYIPEFYHASPLTNYLKSVENAKKMGIDFLDFNAWFLELKKHTKIPLFPQFSTHWSTYGAYMVFDSISIYVEQKLHKKLARYDYSNVYWTDTLINDDDETRQELNLLKDPPQFKLAYPIIKWKDTAGSFKPRLLGIGDSYFEKLYKFNLLNAVYKSPMFWMYYLNVFNYKAPDKREDIGDMDLKSYVEKQNVVILLFTETNFKHLANFGWSFVDDLYNAYQEGPAIYNQRIQLRKWDYEMNRLKFAMKTDKGWFESITNEAKAKNISADSELQGHLHFMFKKEEPNWHQSRGFKIEDIADGIRHDSAWFNYLKKIALEKKVDFNSFIMQNAEYVYEKRPYHNRDSVRLRKIDSVKKLIYRDLNWLSTIEKQSADDEIGLDSCVELNAIYVVDTQNKK